MNRHKIFLAFAIFTLSACSSMNGLLDFADAPGEPVPAAVAYVSATAPAHSSDDGWCQSVAASDRVRVQASGFDAETLDRMTLASYQQCNLLLSR